MKMFLVFSWILFLFVVEFKIFCFILVMLYIDFFVFFVIWVKKGSKFEVMYGFVIYCVWIFERENGDEF